MKRPLLLFFLLLFLFCLFPTTASAQTSASGSERTENEVREGLLAILPDAAKPLLPHGTDESALHDTLGFRSLFYLFVDALREGGSALTSGMLSLITVTLLFGIASLFAKENAAALFMQGCASLSLVTVLLPTAERLFAFFGDLSRFTAGLSPLFVTVFSAGGGGASAAATGGGFAAFLSLLTLFSTTVFPPLLRTLFALALLSSLGNHTLVRELSRKLCGFAVLLFSILSTLLLASLTFQSILASSIDSVAIRTVKFTASSSIPFVGGTLAGTLGALHASLSLLKGVLGGSAVIALIALLFPPLIEVLLLRIALSLSESIAVFTESASLCEVIRRYRSIMDLSLAALTTVSLLFLLMIGVFSGLSPFGS